MHHVRRQPSSRDQRQEGHQVVTQLLACCVLASEVDEERSRVLHLHSRTHASASNQAFLY
jgi:hypothetical protein